MSDAVRRPCSDFMDMLRRLINYRIIIFLLLSKTKNNRVDAIDIVVDFVNATVVQYYRLVNTTT